ncbi:MAG: phosphosulfolactate synthase [Deltaproteobacteria bacterium]|nr:phosphosulfolactate synthase [Deltaproteobacteria bacterium]
MLDIFSLPTRSPKPRDVGVTHVMDKGLGLHQVEDLLSTSSEYIDILKLGWGTGYVTQNILEKIRVYREAGIPVCFGGTLLEVAILQKRFDAYRETARKAGITHVEISNGVIDMSMREKAGYIRELAKEFTVLSEVGSKDSEKIIPPYRWVELIQSDLDAGAWKVICEARESGTVGLYFGSGEARAGLIDEIVAKVDPADLIFESPQKSQQVFMVRKLGSEVNLGNIAHNEVIALETLRLGLRADTMAAFHDVEIWNKRRNAELQAELPRPERRSRGAARTPGRRKLKQVR